VKSNVNLYQALYPTKSLWPYSKKTSIVASAALLVVVSVLSVSAWKLYDLKHKYDVEISVKSLKENAFARLKNNANAEIANDIQVKKLAQMKQEIEEKKHVLDEIVNNEALSAANYYKFFRSLASQDVKNVWLTEVFRGNKGKSVTLVGQTTRPELLGKYVGRLLRDDSFSGLSFIDFHVEDFLVERKKGKNIVPAAQQDVSSLKQLKIKGRPVSRFVISTQEISDVDRVDMQVTRSGIIGALR